MEVANATAAYEDRNDAASAAMRAFFNLKTSSCFRESHLGGSRRLNNWELDMTSAPRSNLKFVIKYSHFTCVQRKPMDDIQSPPPPPWKSSHLLTD